MKLINQTQVSSLFSSKNKLKPSHPRWLDIYTTFIEQQQAQINVDDKNEEKPSNIENDANDDGDNDKNGTENSDDDDSGGQYERMYWTTQAVKVYWKIANMIPWHKAFFKLNVYQKQWNAILQIVIVHYQNGNCVFIVLWVF